MDGRGIWVCTTKRNPVGRKKRASVGGEPVPLLPSVALGLSLHEHHYQSTAFLNIAWFFVVILVPWMNNPDKGLSHHWVVRHIKALHITTALSSDFSPQ